MILHLFLVNALDIMNKCKLYNIKPEDCANSVYMPNKEFDDYISSFNLPIIKDARCKASQCVAMISKNGCNKCVGGSCMEECGLVGNPRTRNIDIDSIIASKMAKIQQPVENIRIIQPPEVVQKTVENVKTVTVESTMTQSIFTTTTVRNQSTSYDKESKQEVKTVTSFIQPPEPKVITGIVEPKVVTKYIEPKIVTSYVEQKPIQSIAEPKVITSYISPKPSEHILPFIPTNGQHSECLPDRQSELQEDVSTTRIIHRIPREMFENLILPKTVTKCPIEAIKSIVKEEVKAKDVASESVNQSTRKLKPNKDYDTNKDHDDSKITRKEDCDSEEEPVKKPKKCMKKKRKKSTKNKKKAKDEEDCESDDEPDKSGKDDNTKDDDKSKRQKNQYRESNLTDITDELCDKGVKAFEKICAERGKKKEGNIKPITLIRQIPTTVSIEVPITLYREMTTTVLKDHPIINYKITTYTEKETTTRTIERSITYTTTEKVIQTVKPDIPQSVLSKTQNKKYEPPSVALLDSIMSERPSKGTESSVLAFMPSKDNISQLEPKTNSVRSIVTSCITTQAQVESPPSTKTEIIKERTVTVTSVPLSCITAASLQSKTESAGERTVTVTSVPLSCTTTTSSKSIAGPSIITSTVYATRSPKIRCSTSCKDHHKVENRTSAHIKDQDLKTVTTTVYKQSEMSLLPILKELLNLDEEEKKQKTVYHTIYSYKKRERCKTVRLHKNVCEDSVA